MFGIFFEDGIISALKSLTDFLLIIYKTYLIKNTMGAKLVNLATATSPTAVPAVNLLGV